MGFVNSISVVCVAEETGHKAYTPSWMPLGRTCASQFHVFRGWLVQKMNNPPFAGLPGKDWLKSGGVVPHIHVCSAET